jgi:hypothetical protein
MRGGRQIQSGGGPIWKGGKADGSGKGVTYVGMELTYLSKRAD